MEQFPILLDKGSTGSGNETGLCPVRHMVGVSLHQKRTLSCSRVVYYGISHKSLVFPSYNYTKYASMFTKKIQVTSGILYGMSQESIA